MKIKLRRFGSVLSTVILCIAVLGACSSEKASISANQPSSSDASGDGREIQDEASGAQPSGFVGPSLGEFTTQDINGDTYTQEIFGDYDLTMVNVFATWCSPCVSEMPDLEELHQQMADRGVNVVGVVLDVLDENGEIIQEELEQARLLVKQTEVTYPILLPDEGYLNGRLVGIDAIPETFFVDKDGNVVGETYSGSGDLEYWTKIVERELADLEGGS